jgi:hypothetical protein
MIKGVEMVSETDFVVFIVYCLIPFFEGGFVSTLL